jgi:hypothetical protein
MLVTGASKQTDAMGNSDPAKLFLTYGDPVPHIRFDKSVT